MLWNRNTFHEDEFMARISSIKSIEMRYIFFFGFFVLLSVVGFSQSDSLKIIKPQLMEQSDMLGLRTTLYKVGDINAAKKWYAKAFGTTPYFDEPFYVGFNIGGYELGLQPEENPTTEKPESVVSYWGVNDIEKTYRQLIDNGATEHEKPFNVGGELMTAAVKDPWGNIIGIIYNPEFKLND